MIAIALSIGIANAVELPPPPKNESFCAAAVFIPMTLPFASTSGPPESPGSIGAEIWIMPCSVSESPLLSPAATGVPDRVHGVADLDVRLGLDGREVRGAVDLDERNVVDDVVTEHLGLV